MHLIIDGECGNLSLLKESPLLEKWLLDMAHSLGMKVIGGPLVVDYRGFPSGLSGVILFAESNITVHTFTTTKEVKIDIFSCRDFDFEETKKLVVEAFKVNTQRVFLLPR